jgi:uncharacterized protein
MAVWIILLIILAVAGAVALRIRYELNHPEVTRYTIKTSKLLSSEQIRIIYIADLHSRKYGENNIRLIQMITRTKPDFIVLGGDMITAGDRSEKDQNAYDLINGLANVAPIYYTPGNHEKKLEINNKQKDRYVQWTHELESLDVPYLKDKGAVLTEDICLYGLDIDLKYYKKFDEKPKLRPSNISDKLGKPDITKFNILAAHTPEFFDTYVKSDYDLVLCGHYHGGVAVLGQFGPLISPDFKFRPEHAGGLYKKGDTRVIVTRGIGSHTINIRLFNRPEIVLIDIKREE